MRISNKMLIIILTVLFLAACGAAAGIALSRSDAARVRVTVNGREYGIYELNWDQTVTIAPPDGSWENVLEICGGKAAIVRSDCTNQICVHTPALQEGTVGVIVCLPHGVVVELMES